MGEIVGSNQSSIAALNVCNGYKGYIQIGSDGYIIQPGFSSILFFLLTFWDGKIHGWVVYIFTLNELKASKTPITIDN